VTISIAGYALVWGDEANLGDGRREQFKAGAFVNAGAKFVFGHDPRAGASLGHCTVIQDMHGAKFTVGLDEHDRDARRVLCAIRAGMTGMSFRFRALKSRQDGDLTIIERALLLEASVVPSPFYTQSGCWLIADEPYLPPHLAALAHQFVTAAPLPARSPKPAAVRSGGVCAPGGEPAAPAGGALRGPTTWRTHRSPAVTLLRAVEAMTSEAEPTDAQLQGART
jgi:HK97 family phage prohead protease